MLPLGSRSRGIEAVYIHADLCSVRNRNCLHADLWSLNTSLIWAQLQFLINQVRMYTASIITQNHKTGCTQGRRNPVPSKASDCSRIYLLYQRCGPWGMRLSRTKNRCNINDVITPVPRAHPRCSGRSKEQLPRSSAPTKTRAIPSTVVLSQASLQ